MESYFAERSKFFNEGSEFSCPDSCERYGCKEPNLHISVSLVDLAAISLTSGQKILNLFEKGCKVGFDPFKGQEPWLGRISIELKKPCSFLDGKACSVYCGRPIACALFPEYSFMEGRQKDLLKRGIFRNFPCIQKPCAIPSQRGEILQKLMRLSIQETFLSDFYLFGISPFLVDLKTVAGAGLDRIRVSDDGKARLPHHRVEGLISQNLEAGGYLEEWEAKVGQLDGTDGLKRLTEMKNWTDQIAMTTDQITPRIAYQFDGNRLLPVHLCK